MCIGVDATQGLVSGRTLNYKIDIRTSLASISTSLYDECASCICGPPLYKVKCSKMVFGSTKDQNLVI